MHNDMELQTEEWRSSLAVLPLMLTQRVQLAQGQNASWWQRSG